METRKQRIFYIVSFLLISIVCFAFGKDIASLMALFMIELNICLSREKHKLRSLVLLIPFLGIVNGLLLPILFVPPYLISLSTKEAYVYQFTAYGLLFVLLVIFYVKGKNWRSWFYENMRNRKLRKSERYLLWMVGILMLLFSNVVAKQILEAEGNVGMAEYVESIANELKKQGVYNDILTDRYMSDMVVAAPLHDIGKIHIPDAVLNKPGKFTDEEFEIMKTHITVGEELLIRAKEELGESGYLNTVFEMAEYHHEWWNGKGYPYGMSGEDIPLEKAYAIIREKSGTHFDPAVVEAFFAADIK